MKKILTLIIVLATMISVKAQWTNNAASNTLIANTNSYAGEVYLSTAPSGDTYVQWTHGASNGYSPSLQRLNSDGVPQWGSDGIHISAHQFPSSSEGFAMTATTDGGVVSCFATDADNIYAVKINADGTFAWGEQGVMLFNGNGFSRTQLAAGDDGGVWALGSTYSELFVQYINADGTLNDYATISDNGGQSCMFGQVTVSYNNNVFVTYEKLGSGLYTDKQLFVAGYATDGTQISEETMLMSTYSFQSTYIHHVAPDGMGGGYVYIWHPGIGSTFNTYVFHFDQYGASTISGTSGVAAHEPKPGFMFLDAYATCDPISHDLLIAFIQTDTQYQTQCVICANRINYIGERIWGDDGRLVLDNGTTDCSDLLIDAFEYGDGYSVIYNKGVDQTGYNKIIEAKGFSMTGDELWTTNMSSLAYPRATTDNSTGFHAGQNIVAWNNSSSGGLYGQNIGQHGELGEVTPPTPPMPCNPPTNFQGEAYYNPETQISAAVLSWTAPETLPLHYNLYCDELKEVIEIDAEYDSFYLELEPGDYLFKLTAWYETCESDFALTPDNANFILIEIPNHQSVQESQNEVIINVIEIYNLNGQRVNANNLEELNQGIYIIKGVTETGKTVIRKIVR